MKTQTLSQREFRQLKVFKDEKEKLTHGGVGHNKKREIKIMKLRIGSLCLMCILLSANFVLPVAASGIVKLNTANVGSFNYFYFGMKFNEVCYVSTEGGNLNVRASTRNNSRIIGKLPNGTMVNILSRGDYISQISARVNRKYIKGWVSNDYLSDCQ